MFVAIPFTLILLRVAVYFRDGYRATSFGIPDLVEIIGQIDKKLDERHNRSWLSRMVLRPIPVQLSFIAHSMGGYVVTSVIRVLSDVFDPASIREGLNSTKLPTGVRDAKAFSRIGHAFCLKRLVLVSPDIPAETPCGEPGRTGQRLDLGTYRSGSEFKIRPIGGSDKLRQWTQLIDLAP